ncbi:MAG: YidC/Oxa1 family membrane protein insertase [Chloroflexi bacterium]|nr:YidC/Oxa1 family membrane protein insertase [Chloroflexota bacterium]MCI0577628.1 YidC/Oxa1 family membrane protein insertase [Chloroflexota bacterium]MCI0644152.1 YidC/Oxa1 family membrane protein insertase [Chloroflexota bacterium]MCI0725265.1 YidC/Oxa1 family membrane protein insertase [Chloroflexota bacterium]
MWDALIIDPMTNALLLFYHFLGNNFVLAIAVFTVVVRLITLPLNLRQQQTSLRMQELQPQIQAIQKKYKDNPAKMQEEFRRIGYNPAESLSGCLPLIPTMVVLLGLYRAIIILLGSTPKSLFELTDRVYGWVDQLVNLSSTLPIPNKFLWMNLAQPDPFYALPILVFVTMYISQKFLTPTPKPQQNGKKPQDENPMASMTQSMQYTMPIMFGFFSLSFPAGLSVYFILSNIISIGQGYITKANMNKLQSARGSNNLPATTGIPETEEVKGTAVPESRANGQPGSKKPAKRSTRQRRRRSAKRR